MTTENTATSKKENLFINLGFNLIIPIMLLTKGTQWFDVPAKPMLIIALLFPIAYGLWDFATRKKLNLFSAIGFLSIFVKGSIGLFELDKSWVAVNEAALPLIFGFGVLITLKTKKPLVKEFLFNDQVFDIPKIENKLTDNNSTETFNSLLKKCTWLLAASFLLSAVLNYVVAKIFIKTDPQANLEQFNQELGAMQGWSYLIITVPTMAVTLYALWVLIKGIKEITGYNFEEVILDQKKK